MQPSDHPPLTPPVPTGVRIASALCWVAGVLTILGALSIGIPAIGDGDGIAFIAVNVLSGGLVCAAAVFIRRQRKLGILLLVIAWAIPTVTALLQGLPVQGSLILFVALLLAAANWKHFR